MILKRFNHLKSFCYSPQPVLSVFGPNKIMMAFRTKLTLDEKINTSFFLALKKHIHVAHKDITFHIACYLSSKETSVYRTWNFTCDVQQLIIYSHCESVQDIIAHLKKESHAQAYSSAMSPPVARQIVAATEAIMGRDGTGEGQKRIRQLKDNTRFAVSKLLLPSKMCSFSHTNDV
jgi:hypothetical protein